jgi:hypothetical protein
MERGSAGQNRTLEAPNRTGGLEIAAPIFSGSTPVFIILGANRILMHHPDRRWLVILGLIGIIAIAILCGAIFCGEKSVSNLYFIPAGVYHPFPGPPISSPSEAYGVQISDQPWGIAKHPGTNITWGEPLVLFCTTAD